METICPECLGLGYSEELISESFCFDFEEHLCTNCKGSGSVSD